ncbi:MULTISPECIES: hypothetical protein [Olivibacter]|jgi:hypothetical protein|uniref:Uncharacterized protein n=3 Tax=Sphingobacteriaceae TaxID=84566 RepID=F4C2S9_SPHS2|nr:MULTISPECIES: hypothetical protein [Olivibacter]MDM8173285.1 hypothetical protein [Olivibacter sp. 47]MDX3915269.1 hypothetical protein [Pseudosphingobacterium sp.]
MEKFNKSLLESYLRIEAECICTIDAPRESNQHLRDGDETVSSMTFTTSNFI